MIDFRKFVMLTDNFKAEELACQQHVFVQHQPADFPKSANVIGMTNGEAMSFLLENQDGSVKATEELVMSDPKEATATYTITLWLKPKPE